MSARRRHSRRTAAGRGAAGGWTLIELLLLVAILGILTAILLPFVLQTLERAMFRRAIADMKVIEADIAIYEDAEDRLPESLDDLPIAQRFDPWGHPYVYFRFGAPGWRGLARKDRFLVPINSRFDLYSIGADGDSRPPLQHPLSLDDVVRANDGMFYGHGRDF